MEVPDLQINVLNRADQVADFLDWLRKPGRDHVAVDTETTGLDWWSPTFKVRLVQFGDNEGGWAIPFEGWPELVRGMLNWASDVRLPLVFHNFAYDYLALKTAGVDLDTSVVQDTMFWAAVLGYADQTKSLKSCAARELGPWAVGGQKILDQGMKNGGWDWATVPLGWKPYPLYGVLDTCITSLLYRKWEKQRPANREHHDLEVAAARLTSDMSWRGLPVDGDYLQEQIISTMEREEAVLERLAKHGIKGPDQTAQIVKALKDSAVDYKPLLTPSGQESMSKDVLGTIQHPIAKDVLEARFVHRLRVAYYESMARAAGGVMGRALMHPEIRSMEARTGRMSVSNPPMQQIPASVTEVRDAVIPRHENEVLCSADFGQIELRVWAGINGDENLLNTLREADTTGGDFFTTMGRDVYHESGFVKEDPRRSRLKSTTYAKLFGGGIEAAAAAAGVDVYSLVPIVKAMETRYPSFADLGNKLISKESGGGYEAFTPTGRRFAVKDNRERRKLPNYLTQGHASEILKKALVALDAAGFGEYMLLPVHDEILTSLPRDWAEEGAKDIKLVMDSIVDPEELGVAVRVNPVLAERWGGMEK